jgi:hypothetical protein
VPPEWYAIVAVDNEMRLREIDSEEDAGTEERFI